MTTLDHLGLELVADKFEELLVERFVVAGVRTFLGRVGVVGGSRPLPSRAALLRFRDGEEWVPCPVEPPEPRAGRAPVYLHGGRELVLPAVRLFRDKAEPGAKKPTVEYLGLADWLSDAVALWRFEPVRGDDTPRTFANQIQEERLTPAAALQGLARLVNYALFGADAPSVLFGLRLPAAPMWLRPVGTTPLGRAVSRGLVVTARLDADPAGPAVPTTNLRAAGYRIRPTDPRDWGLDPVHTPEGNDIRLTGRLGVGVGLRNRGLRVPAGDDPPLSASTARVPFAGHDDPRRLLMAANMQASAVPLPRQELPRVRTAADGTDPPGVNLRVGYLAWQGRNHEDAWVLSESAAKRLATVEETVHTIAIGAVELAPEVAVSVGQTVERGQLLVRRFIAPALLCPALDRLAAVPDLDEKVPLRPEVDDIATDDGTVAAVEEWNLVTGEGVPDGWEVPDPTAGVFRAVYRIRVHRHLPLAVGDKLANRHGHKGVVGAVIPDAEMPRWGGEPLEALIDPVSVLNRSNWGQVYESLAGAVVEPGQTRNVGGATGEQVLGEAQRAGADARGCWPVEPSAAGTWMTRAARAVAGVQFVMRMPHHACDKISGSPLPPPAVGGAVRRRSQRFGEMDQWALWAHRTGGWTPTPSGTLSPAAARFGRLLSQAGFDLHAADGAIHIRRLDLAADPPGGVRAFELFREADPEGEARRPLRAPAELYDELDAVTPDAPTVLVFDPPLVNPKAATGTSPKHRPASVRWLPVLPARDRPVRKGFDGSEEPHELTRGLRRVVRLLRKRHQERTRTGAESVPEDAELYYAVCDLMDDARAAAVGLGATGQFSSKFAFLRRGVLGRRLARSCRATIAPGGPLGLGLAEIGLPPALAHTLLGPGLPTADEAQLAAAAAGRTVWLKRDPVLHRWGLVPVRVRVVPGNVIRMPASLLGPLGADFDGDTVALFAALPGAPDPAGCEPAAIAEHPLLKEAMFKPGKQYQYGLYLLARDPERKERFRQALAEAGAPTWPDADDGKAAFAQWVRRAVANAPQGRWWAVIEAHALDALADDPVMGFGLGTVDELAALPVVRCGAAKNLYDGPTAREMIASYLAGSSLAIYRRGANAGDPIADVMVAAKASIGQFGGALRRLLYCAARLAPADVQKAQALTEQVTQKALSVKAGRPPLKYSDFERQLRRLLAGKQPDDARQKELQALFAEIGKSLEPLWAELGALMPAEPEPWLEWLRKPHELAAIVPAGGALRLPLDDLRMQPWLATPE